MDKDCWGAESDSPVASFRAVILLLVLVAVTSIGSALLTSHVVAAPPGAPLLTALPFQGVLQENGAPVSQPRNFAFALFDAETGGTQVGSSVTRLNLPVNAGLYATTLDFGPGPWTSGEARWIEVTVNGQPLAPRTPVLPSPQALFAAQAGSATTATSATNASNLGGTAASGFTRIYGDGSAGNLLSSGTSTLAATNTSYQDISITGGTLSVPTGTVLRCTGSFTLAAGATIQVLRAPDPATLPASANANAVIQGLPGLSGFTGGGTLGNAGSGDRMGGPGGRGIGGLAAAQLRDPGPLGGGGSTPTRLQGPGSSAGRSGGGTLVVRCAGPVTIQGTLVAAGAAGAAGGGGGSGGGVVILASGTSVTTTGGTVDVRGGAGGTGGTRSANGGGGAGGVIHVMAPQLAVAPGDVLLTGGLALAPGVDVSLSPSRGGSGGGGSCGNGGDGGFVDAINVPDWAEDGGGGCLIQTPASPLAAW